MQIISRDIKQDPISRWALDDRIFFAAGACHTLCYAFIEEHPDYTPVWIKPKNKLSGNHIVAVKDDTAFDYQGLNNKAQLFQNCKRDAIEKIDKDWDCDLVKLPIDLLISEPKSRTYEGLWLREPEQFLENALPRARSYMRSIL